MLAEGAVVFGIRNAATAYVYGNLGWLLQNQKSEAILIDETLISQKILDNMKSKGVKITSNLRQQAQEIEDTFYYGVVLDERDYASLPRTGFKGEIKNMNLPTEGKFRFLSDRKQGVYFDNTKQGYMDRFGNVWREGPYHGNTKLNFNKEWDVILSQQGKNVWGNYLKPGKTYINIRPDGQLSH